MPLLMPGRLLAGHADVHARAQCAVACIRTSHHLRSGPALFLRFGLGNTRSSVNVCVGILSHASQVQFNFGSQEHDSTPACLHWLSKRQESGWGEVLRKSALSLAAVAAVAAPMSFAPQEVIPIWLFCPYATSL